MYLIKPLYWGENEEGSIFSEPPGLMWMYYITPYSDKYELALINEYGEANPDLWINCDSIDEAKYLATNHYMSVITNFLLKIKH